MRWNWREREACWIGVVVSAVVVTVLWWVVTVTWLHYRVRAVPVEVRRIERYVEDHPEVSLEELVRVTPEQLAEMYPEIR
jgi:hypothetical protein